MITTSIDLNICQRGLKGTEWTTESGVITKENLNKVKDQRTDNTSSQNALPTPFARFFLMEDAFRLVTNERKEKIDAGQSYKRMVSDCLDIYELLYNWQYNLNHWKNKSYSLAFRIWDEACLDSLKQQVPLLGVPLSNYIDGDLSKSHRLVFLILKNSDKEFLLACSSPKTGWVTPPDLDKVGTMDNGLKALFVGEQYNTNLFPHIKRPRGEKGYYFRDCCLFEERSAGFKNYMIHYLMSNELTPDSFSSVRTYITSFLDNDDDIKSGSSYHFNGKAIPLGNGERLSLYGLPITCNDGMDATNFFSDAIIKVPFGIARECFKTFEREEDSTIGVDHDYLLPLTTEALEVLHPQDVQLEIRENSQADRVTVSLMYQGEEFKKTYATEPRSNEGELFDTAIMNINFELAMFPNILAADEANNDYFKIALVVTEGNKHRTLDIDRSGCSFFKAGDNGYEQINVADNKVSEYGVLESICRSHQGDKSDYSSKYFELFNTTFDAIMLRLRFDERNFSGVLMPVFKRTVQTESRFTYAVDFGTTNTYVSRREAGEANVPEQLRMVDTMVSYLHRKEETTQKSLINRCETMPFPEAEQSMQTEFIPCFIDGVKYRFPLRTAMSQRLQAIDKLDLFGNTNIAFLYEKVIPSGENFVRTNIKWDEKDDDDRLFIRELLMIIRADVLLSGGNMQQTNIVWFRPLSFRPQQKEAYERIWREETKRILNIPNNHLHCYTESEAPYYYYHEKRTFEENRSVVVIDIGGGSTDMVHFSGNKLTLANSIHFGCDVLWSGGFNRMVNDHEANGVYMYCHDKISFKDETLQQMNAIMCHTGSRYATSDIINFWISNDEESNVTDILRSVFKPLFLYHYVSVIFYLAQMLKSRHLECPTAITFSGNGSRYIDEYLTHNPDVLKDITTMVLKDVLKDIPANIQLVLPQERKESTCYGGLYKKDQSSSAEPYYFVGTTSQQYEDVKAIEDAYMKGELKKELEAWLFSLNQLYLKTLDVLIKREQLVDVNRKLIETVIRTPISMDTIFRNEVFDRPFFNDSLFFLPVTAMLEKLTHLNNQ